MASIGLLLLYAEIDHGWQCVFYVNDSFCIKTKRLSCWLSCAILYVYQVLANSLSKFDHFLHLLLLWFAGSRQHHWQGKFKYCQSISPSTYWLHIMKSEIKSATFCISYYGYMWESVDELHSGFDVIPLECHSYSTSLSSVILQSDQRELTSSFSWIVTASQGLLALVNFILITFEIIPGVICFYSLSHAIKCDMLQHQQSYHAEMSKN